MLFTSVNLHSSLLIYLIHIHLCSVFNYLLDDNPLPANEASSSVLVATYSHAALQNGKGVITGGMLTSNVETEKGLLTLIAADAPGIQVCFFLYRYLSPSYCL